MKCVSINYFCVSYFYLFFHDLIKIDSKAASRERCPLSLVYPSLSLELCFRTENYDFFFQLRETEQYLNAAIFLKKYILIHVLEECIFMYMCRTLISLLNEITRNIK